MIGANDTIRIGIIGCGGIANGKHMPGLKSTPGIEMVAFCDIIIERRRPRMHSEPLSQLHHGRRARGGQARNVREADGDQLCGG